MPTLEELKMQAKELNVKNMWFTRREFHYLPKILAEDEKLKAFASGLMNGKTWLIVATNRRIIFLDKGLIYRLNQVEIPLTKINSISQKEGLFLGEINIWDGASNMEIRNVAKRYVANFVNAVNQAMEDLNKPNPVELSNNSVSDELMKLEELRERGILTDEEFSEQKQKLLNN